MFGNLNFKFLLIVYILILSSFIGFFNSQSFDLNENNFENFKKRTNEFMITVCSFTDSRCKNLKTLFDDAALKLKEKFNFEFKFPFGDTNTLTGKITSEYPYEGFPSSYFVNQSEKEKELYVGLRDINSVMKFLEYKIIYPEENLQEAKNESELNSMIEKTPEKNVLLLLGDIASYRNINFRLLQLSSRKAGIQKIIQLRDQEFLDTNFINDYELALFNPYNSEDRYYKLKIQKTKEYEVDELSDLMKMAYYNRNKENLFSDFNDDSLSLALNHGISNINFFYSKKEEQLKEDLETSLKNLAIDYQDEVMINKGSINNQIIKELKIVKHYNITRNDLPLIMFTKRPQVVYNSNLQYGVSDFYDVEKYFLKKSQLVEFVKKYMGDYLKTKTISEEELEFSAEIIEKFYELCKNGQIEKEKVTTDQNRIEMNGHNFIEAINEALKEGVKGIVMLICPKSSKKYARTRFRVERVFNKIYKANSEQIIFDEFDPFLDEISFINVEYYPSIVIIQNAFKETKWKVLNFKGQLSTREITRFIKSSFDGTIYEQDLNNEREVFDFEKKNKLYPIHRKRYEGKILSENKMSFKFNVGLKRRWNNLRRFKMVKENPRFDDPNEFQLDDLSDDFYLDDDVDESIFNEKNEQNSASADDLSLDNDHGFKAKIDL